MTEALDIVAIGNAIVDVIAPAEDGFLASQGLRKGAMTLIDDDRAAHLYSVMAPGVETSGGSAANTVAGVASLGGKAAFVGKVADDFLGEVYTHDIEAIGATFKTPKLAGAATGRCLINVTHDAHRTMATFLGAASQLGPADVDEAEIGRAYATYLEGYLFDPPPAREAFVKAAAAARAAGRKVAMTLSDVFVVERWRDELIGFLDRIDIVFANEVELKALFETDNFDAACDLLSDRVETCAITRGEHGSLVRRGHEFHLLPAFPIAHVIDTTGAGDQYAAGFLFGLARDLPLDQCGALGALCAWEVIGHYGPRPQVSLEKLAKDHGIL
ncbi:MAG TPA: adenosine kinase [Caulobacteraceae bacterium]|jgi:sugar/nucleoside kinase (ribokinase family)|nr:adenosine kinase [Caulobacteraceae bacterium]